MATRSKPIVLYDEKKKELINPDSLELFTIFKKAKVNAGKSDSTIYNYESDLMQWMIWILDNQNNISIRDITEDDIEEFIYFCKKNGNNTARIKRRLSSISSMYKTLRMKKIIKENPVDFIERPNKEIKVVRQTYLTQKQVDIMKKKLNEYVESTTTIKAKNNAMTVRLYALFSLSTMARVNAVRNIVWRNIDFDACIVSDVLEKEGKIVDLSFNENIRDLLKELKKYRKENGIEDGGYVFVGTKINGAWMPITSSTAGEWCKKIGEMIDEPTLHPHDFRHSGATLLKNAGMSLEDVSSLLNHAGTDVTNKYYIKKDTTKIQSAKDRFEI